MLTGEKAFLRARPLSMSVSNRGVFNVQWSVENCLVLPRDMSYASLTAKSFVLMPSKVPLLCNIYQWFTISIH